MNREKVFNCLGPTAYAALAEAVALGRSHRHAYIDLDHWILSLLQRAQSDLSLLLEHFGIDIAECRRRVEKALMDFTVNGDSLVDISASLERNVGPAIMWSQVSARSARVRSGHLLLAWLDDESTRRWLKLRAGGDIALVLVDEAAARYESLASSWPEAAEISLHEDTASRAHHTTDSSNAEAVLQKWATNMTAQAAANQLDPVVGRDSELRVVIDVLSRRRQNNPILVGEAGVGKTAIVEALAQKIHEGAVPPRLAGAQVWALDLARMQAGAGVRGEFEQRLKSLVDAVAASAIPIVLFCDETHTLIGAGGPAGTGDAANLIKPMLARGQLRMIAATTWAEYKQHIEPDAALTRRFQPVIVEEPDDATATDMLRTVAPHFARHHHVYIVDSALQAAVTLSRRYLPARQLPDKAVSLLDTACARVTMSQNCAPAQLEALRHQANAIARTLAWRQSDRRRGVHVPGDEQLLESSKAHLLEHVAELEQRFDAQRADIQAWLAATGENERSPQNTFNTAPALAGQGQFVQPWVNEHVIAEVLAEWTGVPVAQLAKDDAQRVVDLERLLNTRILGQPDAARAMASALQIAHSGLGDPNRPLGVLLLAGATGCGKSLAAAKLADVLFGGEENLIQFNMNEFQESHTVSTLKGAPPGYVGYGKGGRLTEAIRKRPYCVLLLDEFDRAHPDIHEIFYQVFDQGWMEDGEGRHINFRNCLILLTTNLGDAEIQTASAADPALGQDRLNRIVIERLQRHFSPALLARIQTIAFRPLDEPALTGIAAQALQEIRQRLKQQNLHFHADEPVCAWVARAVSTHPANGRAVRDLLHQHVLPAVAMEILAARASGRTMTSVHLTAHDTLSLAFEYDAAGD
jgi:type VI secretion system protein VasG